MVPKRIKLDKKSEILRPYEKQKNGQKKNPRRLSTNYFKFKITINAYEITVLDLIVSYKFLFL